MAKLKEMIDIAGSINKAELMAIDLIKQDKTYLMDLQLLLAAQGRIEESWVIQQQAEAISPKDDRVLYNKGWHIMLQGDQLEGFKLMNKGRNVNLWGNAHIGTLMPIWQPWEVGKRVLFNCEAGFGDEIVFIRFAKQIVEMGNKVIVRCKSGLAPLFSRMDWVSGIVTDERAALMVYHDSWVPAMLAPVLLRTGFDDLNGESYITASQKDTRKFSQLINSDKFKVGIRWLGMDGDDYINRCFPRQQMFDAVMQDHVQLYSLQKDRGFDDLPNSIIDLEPFLTEWEDTAGAIANLDLVISSCTSVAHLAAAMGKPTWVIVPAMMYYIWCYPGNSSPWYDSVKLFRQEKYDNWDKPFNKVKEKLYGYK